MKKHMIFTIIGTILCACNKIPKSAVDMTCDKYKISAAIYSDRIEATINGNEIVLGKFDTSSGTKYKSITRPLLGAILWDKGETWTMFLTDGGPEISCDIIVHDIGTQVVEHWTVN